MALVHEFERSGNWLFRRRSWLPLFLVAAGILILWGGNRQAGSFNLRDEMVFLAISLTGEIIRILTVGFAPQGTSGRNTSAGQVAWELNETGAYSLVRHPLYAGNFLMWLGPVLFLRSAWFTVIFILVYWLYYERIMFAEEQFLRRKFGEKYDEYSSKVYPIIPFKFNFLPPALPFSLRNVLKREYHSFVNIFLIFAALDISRNYFLTGRLFITDIWIWLTCGAGIIWLIIRLIHKFTDWLEVEGR
ncbi:MAG TPA: isoprenylcysteine carboxylmethyltransferase family protein [Bacteroidales bacterium]|jgi:protein-S-isoprenylcysteine O-methyltransferase Ste14|nr:isoprenylcysteine carboxylmethyltransferase family protein [Bacteroidales bacterium]HOS71537.1 isoprenylcysteine carboxylmethyltransferase family protein [Bacteroidales bacterium]HQH23125.1 isoprenylcysteine carboxylmethyltransferase family protein [Bacteroidales bacterium]HQJ81017.1 isoprenylcysteine carboxylmethyltransferase family protein [Bacteroidales bacterium]